MWKTLDGRVLTEKDIGNLDDYDAFAPGVGMVKEEMYHTTRDGRKYVWLRRELMEVTLK